MSLKQNNIPTQHRFKCSFNTKSQFNLILSDLYKRNQKLYLCQKSTSFWFGEQFSESYDHSGSKRLKGSR
jgi:hypothetical protein